MGKIIFVIGGARSGKSSYAERLARGYGKKRVCYIATGAPLDAEMAARIRHHKKKRPRGWTTAELPLLSAGALKKLSGRHGVLIIDCLTLFVSNLMAGGAAGRDIEKRMRGIVRMLKAARCDSIVVANEVGLGIVPENALARRFRDIAGRVNQITAKAADECVFMCAGIPMVIKDAAVGRV